ncbi:MAG: hypothetical protein PSV35_09245 [bacterium]|nr:hypothetical protein [bacterium]
MIKMMKPLSLMLLLCEVGFAGTMGELVVTNMRPFTTINAGAEFMHAGESQRVSIIGPIGNYYTVNKSYQSSGLLGVAAGIETSAGSGFIWQLGIVGYYNSKVKARGDVWEFGLPEYDDFTYSYTIQSKRLMATGKLLVTYEQRFHPYLSADLGVGFNRASNYREIPLLTEVISTTYFSNTTTSSFAWGAGLGVDTDISNRFRLGIGYQFEDLGKVSLGPSLVQVGSGSLHSSHQYGQQVRLQLSAFI